MDPLEQMQQWLQAQQKFWQHLHDQQKDKTTGEFFATSDTIDATAEQLNQQAKAYSEFAQSFIEQVQDSADNNDVIKQFLDSFKSYRDTAALNQMDLPPGLEAFFENAVKQNVGGLQLTAFQSHWNRQFDRIKTRFKTVQQSYAGFQQALTDFQAIEKSLNEAIFTTAQSAFKNSDLSDKNSSESAAKLRKLIDQWVDIYEKHYLAMVQTEEYQQAYKALIKSSTQLQKDAQQTWDEEYRLLGLVPVQDYDDLLAKHHQLEKQHRRQQKQIDQLAKQVESLTHSATGAVAKKTSPEETAQKS